MDSITYRGINMTVLRSLSWEREPILDDSHTTYLYTRWRGDVIVTYQPAAVSFDRNLGNAPVVKQGQLPPLTDNAIRTYLEQPRGQLTVRAAGGIVVIQSPPNPNSLFATTPTCDARNGPIVRVNSIQQIPGERLWQIHLGIETWVNESPSPQLFLSNRWSAHADVDWQHLTTITYQGVVTVRADLLRNAASLAVGQPAVGVAPMNLDAMRSVFAGFRCPNNFQRTRVNVQVYPDGNSAAYTVVDTEQLWNKANSQAVRIEVQDSAWYWSANFSKNVAATVAMVPNGPGALLALVPKAYKRVHVRLWGDALTFRTNLVRLGMGIALFRNGLQFVGGPLVAEWIVTQDTNNCVDVFNTISVDPAGGGTLAFVFNTLAGINFSDPLVGQADRAISQFFSNALGQDSRTQGIPSGANGGSFTMAQQVINSGQRTNLLSSPNPAFYTDAGQQNTVGTRGSSLQQLIVQTLESFNTPPSTTLPVAAAPVPPI